MPKSKKDQECAQKIGELTADLQRIHADFQNYRNRVEAEKANLADLTKAATIMKLLPVVDNIERALAHAPDGLADNTWVQGVVTVAKGLDKSLGELGLTRIPARPGTPFDPHLHEAVVMEEGDGEQEIVTEELRPGYMLGSQVVRHSMVKVGRQ